MYAAMDMLVKLSYHVELFFFLTNACIQYFSANYDK